MSISVRTQLGGRVMRDSMLDLDVANLLIKVDAGVGVAAVGFLLVEVGAKTVDDDELSEGF